MIKSAHEDEIFALKQKQSETARELKSAEDRLAAVGHVQVRTAPPDTNTSIPGLAAVCCAALRPASCMLRC